MAHFEAFCRVISSSIILLFLKCSKTFLNFTFFIFLEHCGSREGKKDKVKSSKEEEDQQKNTNEV